MRACLLITIGFTLLCASCSSPETSSTNTELISSGPRHPVTEKMAGVTAKLANSKVQQFEAPDLAGKTTSLATILEKGPAVVYSIKEGCPCSTDFEPFANSFSKRYADKATVVGIYNESAVVGNKWADQHSSKHPILVDPTLRIVKQLKQERSVYISLIGRNGEIVNSWAGYSKSMLLELDELLQQELNLRLEEFDTAYAPATPASGCQLFEGEGYTKGDLR